MQVTNRVHIESSNEMRPAMRRSRSWILLVALVLAASALNCSSASQTSADSNSDSTSSNDPLEITDEIINDRINGARVRNIPEENGAGEPISWGFYGEEPKEITVVEKQIDGGSATVILDIRTTSNPKAKNRRYLSGRIRTEWELQTGWVLRRWEIVKAENISMKYRNLTPLATPNAEQ